jgi:hypothetical protein
MGTILFSCSKTEAPTPYLSYDYFPTEIGHWVIYDVDSIVYNDFTGKVDTFNYQVKELIESEFKDNADRTSQRIERYFRKNENSPWNLTAVWFSTLTEVRAEKTEENIKYVKLIFPPRKGKTWDGNAFNNLQEWEYQYTEVHQPFLLNASTIIDSTITIQQIDDFNLIEQKNYQEVYAKGIGLIFKSITDLKTEVNGTIKSGLKYNLSLKEYGKN